MCSHASECNEKSADDLVDLLSPLLDVFTGINHQFDYGVLPFLGRHPAENEI